MARKRKSSTWLQRQSLYLIGGIAVAGMAVSAGCSTKATLAGSPYLQLGPLPLPLLGAVAYGLMAALALGQILAKSDKGENTIWVSLFAGNTALAVASGYLMYVMTTVVQEFCLLCAISAVLSLCLWGLTLVGRRWNDRGQLLLPGLAIALVTLVASAGLYGYGQNPDSFVAGNPPPAITTSSGESEIALAQHLTAVGATKYGAWWCPHCHAQQTLFGREAFAEVTYVECDEEGINPQPETCRAVGVQSYPTWEINGQLYAGVQSLQNLARASGYTGPQNFIERESQP